MLLDLSDRSAETLQQQIARQVRARVLSGELEAGVELPSIRGLARQVRVSVITVSRAYEQLVREGVIHPRRGKGYYVSPITQERKTDMALDRFAEQLQTLVGSALDEGLTAAAVRHALEATLSQRRAESEAGAR
ncbi:MAG: GntR family transcriptional regulator [Gemmatimonadota bacterium]